MNTYCKYYKQKEQISYDDGTTWSDTGNYRKGSLYEYDSEICTYNPVEVYSGQPFTFEAIDNCTFGVTIRDNDTNSSCQVLYSLDSGSTWDSLYSTGSSVSVAAGNKIYFKSFWGQYWHSGIFVTTGRFNVEGNIMSLPWGDDFIKGPFYVPEMKKTLKKTSDHNEYYYEFREMLKGCTGLISARNLLLPATQDMKQWVYTSMFSGCTSLTMPLIELPAPTVPIQGYQEMFKDCCSLIETPEILATTADESAFESMFENCTSLSKVMQSLYAEPSNPTYLSSNVYKSMFKYCINIETSPDLLMKHLRGEDMFRCCLNLKNIYSCTLRFDVNDDWLLNIYPSGTFEKVFSSTVPGIPSGWTITETEWCENYKYVGIIDVGRCKTVLCSGNAVLSRSDVVVIEGNVTYTPVESYIGECVNTIDEYTFTACTRLTKVVIPDSVTSIGKSAFNSCYSLRDITIPSGITTINQHTFYSCRSISGITIPSGVTNIGTSAFNGCTGLTGVTVLATTPPILGSDAFSNTNDCPIYVPCDSVDTYKSASGWSNYASRINAIPGSCESDKKWIATYTGGTTSSAECDSTSAITQNEITLTDLASVEIGQCVTSIGYRAFYNCVSLTSIAIPSGVTSIGDRAFWGCTHLSSVEIPDSVASIGFMAFTYNIRLTSVTIGSNVESIGESAFEGCTGLTSITVNATTPPSLGSYAFESANDCPIYVPAESVETYKSASRWSTYADRIQAIP